MGANKWNRRGLALALMAVGAFSAQSAMAAAKKVPLPKPRPGHPCRQGSRRQAGRPQCPAAAQTAAGPLPGLSAFAQANVGLRGGLFESRATFKPLARPVSGPFAVAPTTATSPADIAVVKQVIDADPQGQGCRCRRRRKLHHRSGRPQARRMGDPAQRQHQADVRALRRLRERQSELAARAAVPPPRRERAVERPARRQHRARIFRQP